MVALDSSELVASLAAGVALGICYAAVFIFAAWVVYGLLGRFSEWAARRIEVRLRAAKVARRRAREAVS